MAAEARHFLCYLLFEADDHAYRDYHYHDADDYSPQCHAHSGTRGAFVGLLGEVQATCYLPLRGMYEPFLWHSFCVLSLIMKRMLFLSTLLVALVGDVLGQRPAMHRTPEEIAEKQTERMVRELNITDSLLCDTLYQVHLRYARTWNPYLTPEECDMHRDSLFTAIRSILTPRQYRQFIASLQHQDMRSPQTSTNHFPAPPAGAYPPPPPPVENGEVRDTPPPPPTYLQ